MHVVFSYWYMFFACIAIASIAMSAGIGGATFFVPFILLALKVPVRSAISIGIFVEIFGFSAGVYNYYRRGQIDFSLAKSAILVATPFVIIGVILNHFIKPNAVQYIFILALMIFATQLLLGRKIVPDNSAKPFDRISSGIAALGGLFLGFLSSGMGESNEYSFFTRLHRTPAITAGTSVLVVAVSAVIATATQIYFLFSRGGGLGSISPYTMLIIYSIAGSLIGAKLGAVIANRINRREFRIFVSILLYLVAGASVVKTIYFK